MKGWVVYSRPDCSLCEALYGELADLLGGAASSVKIVDVSGDPELERRYGSRVPVLAIDGEFVCAYRLDHDRIRAYPGPGGA